MKTETIKAVAVALALAAFGTASADVSCRVEPDYAVRLADKAGDAYVKVTLAADNATEGSLVKAAANTAYHKFDVEIDETPILPDTIDLDTPISGTGTVCDGWGFTVENSVLKFKHLA